MRDGRGQTGEGRDITSGSQREGKQCAGGKAVSSKKTIAETAQENKRVFKDLAVCPVALDKLLVDHKLRDPWFPFKIWWEHIEKESEVKRFKMNE